MIRTIPLISPCSSYYFLIISSSQSLKSNKNNLYDKWADISLGLLFSSSFIVNCVSFSNNLRKFYFIASMKRTSHYSKKNSTKGIVYSRSRFLLFAKKKNSNPLSLSLPPDIRLFSNKRANAWHARVTLISFDGVTFTTPKKRKKKYKILGAESSASGTWGEDGENCWIRRGGGNFFFFFFSKCRRYKT